MRAALPVAKLGCAGVASGIAMMIAVPLLLPLFLDVPILPYLLLLIEQVGRFLVVVGAVLLLIASWRLRRGGPRTMRVLVMIGLLLADSESSRW